MKTEVIFVEIDQAGYLVNETGPVPLVLDLRIVHDRVGSITDPNLNGLSKYPNNLDQSVNDASADKIRKYRADYNNRSPSVVSFIPVITSTSGRLHSEFVRLLFLQSHGETDRFFEDSGVLSAQSDRGFWGSHHFKNTYSPITLTNISSINVVFIFRCSSSTSNPVYARRVESSALVFSLSLRHSYIGLVISCRFID